MKEITLTLSADYSGDVTFYNDNGWLPDLYSLVIKSNGGSTGQTAITGYDGSTGIVSIVKGSDFPAKAVVVLAGYSNGTLTDIKYAPVGAENDIEVGTVEGDTYKIFLWDSLEGMQPLCEEYTNE